MNTFAIGFSKAWDVWASVFSPLPFGDPYVAAFGAVFIAIWTAKMVMKGLKRF